MARISIRCGGETKANFQKLKADFDEEASHEEFLEALIEWFEKNPDLRDNFCRFEKGGRKYRGPR